MPRGRRRARFLALALAVAGGVQIPMLAALVRLLSRPAALAVVGVAVALTASFISSMRASLRGHTGKLHVYLGLWPFFLWWTVALHFALLAPLALILAALLPALPAATAVGGALAAAALATIPAVALRPRLRRHDITIAGLPEAFDGYRIAQISDLHCGPFASGTRVSRWVRSVNALDADLVAVTGDLIASGDRFVPVVAEALGGLRARDSVLVSMGNHDYFADGEALVRALEEAGLTVLRNRGVEIERAGGATLFVAGVDDTWTGRHDIGRALAARPAGAPVVLLAHDPALFPEAAERGVELTLSGHTHGGQLAIPGVARRLNLARLITRFTTGLYRQGSATLYVNRGLGTTGPPIRLGVPPEIALLTLRRAPPAAAGTTTAPPTPATATTTTGGAQAGAPSTRAAS